MRTSEKAPWISAQRGENAAAVPRRRAEEMKDDLAVGRCLEDGTFALEFVAQDIGVDQIPLCAIASWPRKQSTTKGCAFLTVLEPGRRITRMADRARPLEPCQFVLTEHLRNQAHIAMQLERSSPVRWRSRCPRFPARDVESEKLRSTSGRPRSG
jgi:hypothetical protein